MCTYFISHSRIETMRITFDVVVENGAELMEFIGEWHKMYPLMELESVKDGPNNYPIITLSADELMLDDFCNTVLGDDLSVFIEE